LQRVVGAAAHAGGPGPLASTGVELRRETVGTARAGQRQGAAFERQRSLESTRDGQGTNASPYAYTWADKSASASQTYYRLVQLDADGTTNYSQIVVVRGTESPASLLLYPNPAHDLLTVAVPPATTEVVITDVTGRTVLRQPVTGEGTIQLTLNLPTGIYLQKAGATTTRLIVE
jgi:trimeric autotransporter adhesin